MANPDRPKGGPDHAKYTPLAESEQDAVGRMVEKQDLMVEVEGWGFHPNPHITYGDKRLQIKFPIEFERPEGVSAPVSYFDLKLKLRNGRVLAESRESTYHNGQPLMVTAGMQIDLVWDLALDEVPEDVRSIVIPDLDTETVGTIDRDEYVSNQQEERDGPKSDGTSSSKE